MNDRQLSEEWIGHSLYRIKDAVTGEPLDNTPEGNLVGILEQFQTALKALRYQNY